MGVVHVKFMEECAVVVGGQPDEPHEPILNPREVGRTNTVFMMPDGLHCFSLETSTPFTPPWQVRQVHPGATLELIFTRP